MRGIALATALVLAACAREAPPSGPLMPINCTSNGQSGMFVGFSLENITLVGDGPPRRVVILTHLDRISGVEDKYPDNRIVMGRYDRCDFSGRFVSAGLIDSHVHLATQPDQTEEEATQRLRQALLGGVTSVRDMGGRGDLLMRWAAAAEDGSIEAPRIYYSALITGPDSDFWMNDATGEYVSLGAPGRQPWFYRIDATTDLSAVLNRMHDAGVTGIKVHSGIDAALLARLGIAMNPPPPPPDDVQYRVARPRPAPPPRPAMFWSHATIGPATPSEAINAGATVLSHADMLSFEGMRGAGPEFWRLPYGERITRAMREAPANGRVIGNLIRLMKEHDVVLEPTLFVIAMAAAQAREDGSPDLARYEAQYAYAAAVTRRAHRAGVRIAAGTDALGGETPNIHAELFLLVRDAGLSPREALVAATETNASAVGVHRLRPSEHRQLLGQGMPADLVIYDRNPLADIRNTQSISAMVVRGRLIQRTTPLAPAPLTNP